MNCPGCGRYLIEFTTTEGGDSILWICTKGDYVMQVMVLARRHWRRVQ